MYYHLVVSEFNEELISGLVDNTINSLIDSEIKKENIEVSYVSGAYEIPQVISYDISKGKILPKIYIALGAVIDGETNHAQMIISSTGKALLDLSIKNNVFIINEIVGAPSYKCDYIRCVGNKDTRGWYAGKAAVKIASNIISNYE